MFENKIIKLFAIGFLCLLITSKARSVSISQIGDVRIEVSDGKWICDKIQCPLHTHRCFVSKHQDPNDPSILVRTNICYSKDNVALKESRITEIVDPNSKIRVQVNSYRSGVISSVNSYSSNGNGENFDETKFKEELDSDLHKMREDLDSQMGNLNKNLHREMANLNRNLHHMTQNINRGIENQMKNLDYSLSNMFN